MRAYRIKNNTDGTSYFEKGTLPEGVDLDATRFFIKTTFESYQLQQHTAPRYQYVITLKGRLQFTTSDEESFFIEPGVILIAEDIFGEGHSWKIVDGVEWERIYIVPNPDANDQFIKD